MRERVEAGVTIEAAERPNADDCKKVTFNCTTPMRTRRLDASALRAIWFRAHVNSLSADDCRSGRTENAREIPARSPRRAFSVRLRIIAANGDSSNTGKYVSRYVRCRTQGTRLRTDCASQYRCSRAPSTAARVRHPEKPMQTSLWCGRLGNPSPPVGRSTGQLRRDRFRLVVVVGLSVCGARFNRFDFPLSHFEQLALHFLNNFHPQMMYLPPQ